ncbi:MAG: hypothetical protein JKY98_09540 [Gammaproteobacteria bacterium]|nr:hypothetical protein [Gammaproteobacteria bacterium]
MGLGNHGFTAISRYTGDYEDLTAALRFDDSNPFVQSLLNETIDSYNRIDVQYRYTHDWADSRLGTTVFTTGVLDLFDADIPYREVGGLNYDAQVHDGRGRRVYVRALWQF